MKLRLRGREDSDRDEVDCVLGYEATNKYASWTGSEGLARVDVYESSDCADRGGVVIRLTLEQDGVEARFPTAKLVENGVEIHLGGGCECDGMLDALLSVLSIARRNRSFDDTELITIRRHEQSVSR